MYDIIFNRRNAKLKEREEIWKLVYDSYKGGYDFYKGDYLFKEAKESETSFSARKKRAVYFNQVQPVADLLSGFLFVKEPSRKNTTNAEWIIQNSDKKGKTINEFMKIASAFSLLFTCGVLVDSPVFDPIKYPTMKNRKDANLNPYCVLYLPFDIVDFSVNKEDGQLDWIILKNDYYDNSDYLKDGENKEVRRLWTRSFYQDFEKTNIESRSEIKASKEYEHGLGMVPFKFISWKDDDSDFIGESDFEDIAMISRLIYNKMSEMDIMLASGAIKVLMYPSKDGKIPSSLVSGGISSLTAIPFDGNLGKAPFFDGTKLEEIEPFLKAIEFYISEILKKIGLDTDETKDYVKSGLSKKIDFQKVRTLLTSGSIALQSLEVWIYSTAAKWTKKDNSAEIQYYTQYADEDIALKIDLLTQLLSLPFAKLKKSVYSLMVKHLLTGEMPQSELDEIYTEIDQGEVIDIKKPDTTSSSIESLVSEESTETNNISTTGESLNEQI